MSTLAAFLTVLAVLAFSLPAAWWQIRRAARHESERNRLIREAHARAELATGIDALELAWNLPAYTAPDPELDAGCDRLWDAIRDQQKSDEQS